MQRGSGLQTWPRGIEPHPDPNPEVRIGAADLVTEQDHEKQCVRERETRVEGVGVIVDVGMDAIIDVGMETVMDVVMATGMDINMDTAIYGGVEVIMGMGWR